MLQSAFCSTLMLMQANAENLFQLKGLVVIINLFRPEGTEYVDDKYYNDNNNNNYNDDDGKRKD